VALGAEETKHERCAVELAEPVPESGAGDEAAPALADECGTDEARGVVWREAEEDHLDEVVHQSRYLPRRCHASQIDVTRQGWRSEDFLWMTGCM
jgi:hypothetical protein